MKMKVVLDSGGSIMHLVLAGRYKSASLTHALSIRSAGPREHGFCHAPRVEKPLAGIRHTPFRIWKFVGRRSSVLALPLLAGLNHHYVRVNFRWSVILDRDALHRVDLRRRGFHDRGSL